MLTAEELDLVAVERARRGLTIPLDQMLLWATLVMDAARGPRKLMRSTRDALIASVKHQIVSDKNNHTDIRPIASTETTPSHVLSDYLEDAGIPGTHIVRWNANGNAVLLPRSATSREWNIGPRLIPGNSNPLILGETPQQIATFDQVTKAPLPESPLYHGYARNGQYLSAVLHAPLDEPTYKNSVVHSALANSWNELMTHIQDFPSWAKKLIVKHALRSFGTPGKPNVRKLSREHLDQYQRPEGTVRLYHYADPSLASQPSFTTDPNRIGQNKWSQAERKQTGFPRTLFYTDLADKEGYFGGKPLFATDYPADKIYDAAKDPNGFVETNRGGINGLLARLKEAGYHGIFYSASFPTVAMWEPVTVHKAEDPQKLARPDLTATHVNVPGGKAGERRLTAAAEPAVAKPTNFFNLLEFADHLNEAVPSHRGVQALHTWLYTGDPSALRAHFALKPTDNVSAQIMRVLKARRGV